MSRSFYLISALLLHCAAASAALITFDDVEPGTTVSFSVTAAGLTADFSSDTAFFVFEVNPASFALLSGNALVDSNLEPNTLDITFHQPIRAVTFQFALRGDSSDELMLTAYRGGSEVGTASASGFVIDGYPFPEGTISFESSTLDRLVLSSSALDFAIDSVNADADAVIPEPSSAILAGAGLALAAAMKRLLQRS